MGSKVPTDTTGTYRATDTRDLPTPQTYYHPGTYRQHRHLRDIQTGPYRPAITKKVTYRPADTPVTYRSTDNTVTYRPADTPVTYRHNTVTYRHNSDLQI